jgi:peptidyl-prolyl cis-trans isomerase D
MAKNPTQQRVVTKKHMARVDRERRQRRILLTIAGTVFGIIILVIAYGLLDQFVLRQNRAVATVNNERITLNEFQSQVKFTRWQMIQQYQSTLDFYQFFQSDPTFAQNIEAQLQQMASNLSPQNAQQLGSEVLSAMIDDEVIRQEAARRGITVTDEEVEIELQEAFGFFAAGTPTPAAEPTPYVTSTLNPTQLALVTPTPEVTEEPIEDPADEADPEAEVEETEVEETPVDEEPETDEVPEAEGTPFPTSTPLPTPTPYTLEGFQERLGETVSALSAAGVSEAELREVVRMQILRQKMFDEITADVPAEEEQIWARHILVPDSTIADEVYARLEAGDDWTQLASEMSTDESNKFQGGDLGWFGRGLMVAEFESAAFDLEIGEISGPVETRFGIHIIQLLGREVRPLTADQLQTARQIAFQEWLDQLKSEQDIEEFDNWTRDVPTTPAIPVSF